MASLRQMSGPGEFFEELRNYKNCESSEIASTDYQVEDEKNDIVEDEQDYVQDVNFARLADTIESYIVPKLVMSHRPRDEERHAGKAKVVEPTLVDVREFSDIVMKDGISDAHQFIAQLTDRGISLEAVYLGLLAPAARELGDQWTNDVSDFTSVTLGLSRMQQVLHAMSDAFIGDQPEVSGKQALMVTVPGEQHGLGALMVGEFFRLSGWSVWTGTPESDDEVMDLLTDEPFDIVGFSASCDIYAESLEKVVQKVRRDNSFSGGGILAGGRLLVDNPELGLKIGADAIGIDAKQAVHKANRLLG